MPVSEAFFDKILYKKSAVARVYGWECLSEAR